MDDDDEVLCSFGTALEPLTEESPQVKAVNVSDQIVVDENGKRRFHGAFTGGFSAGFWNTVGSLEGWKPQSFKSSRSQKASYASQDPTNFMDDEDLGEFGIAPKRVQSTDKFKKVTENRRDVFDDIFDTRRTVEQYKENVGKQLLTRMGWKPGQGAGPRLTRTKKKVARRRNAEEQSDVKRYGCAMGPLAPRQSSDVENDGSSEDDEESDDSVTYAPDDFDLLLQGVKDNRFGLGYKGLYETVAHSSGRQQAFEVLGKNNKKLSIKGQAFGVGAFEDEDEDIYSKEDMTNYDFDLNEKHQEPSTSKQTTAILNYKLLTGFTVSEVHNKKEDKKIFVISLPRGFTPRNWEKRKTRFDPIPEETAKRIKQSVEYLDKQEKRKKWDKTNMMKIVPEEEAKPSEIVQKSSSSPDDSKLSEPSTSSTFRDRLMTDRFVSTAVIDETGERPIEPNNQTQGEASTTSTPFISIISRYLDDDRFTTTQADHLIEPVTPSNVDIKSTPAEVAEIKIIKSVRSKTLWTPASIICKRFNVEPPRSESHMEDTKKHKKDFILFDYLPGKELAETIPPKLESKKPAPTEQSSMASNTTTTLRPTNSIPETISNQRPSFEQSAIPQKQITEILSVAKSIQPSSMHKQPVTELEKQIANKKNDHPSGKRDLFKTIFEDDDSDADNDMNNESIIDKTYKTDTTAPEIIPMADMAYQTIKESNPGGTANTERIENIVKKSQLTMPKPEGIFSNIYDIIQEDRQRIKYLGPAGSGAGDCSDGAVNSSQGTGVINADEPPTERNFHHCDNEMVKPVSTSLNSNDIYGPSLPTAILNPDTSRSTVMMTNVTEKPVAQVTSITTQLNKKTVVIEEMWVEKLSSAKKSKHKDKKHKKDKEKKKKKKHK